MGSIASRVMGFVSFAAVVICSVVVPKPLGAQTVTGTILGVVQDQQGAVVAKAEVSARNRDTGVVRTTVADENGIYRIPSVPAGSYDVSVSSKGFKTEVRTGIIVTVGGDTSVTFSLTIGAVSEQVEVKEEAPQVDTSSATMGGFVNSSTVVELPLNGRDWLQLSLLQPGVDQLSGAQSLDKNRAQRGNGLALTMSGGRATDNVFRIDGLVVNDYANGGPGSPMRVNMGVDAIQEFSVLTNSYSAEYGRSSGGVVNAITKSGTNQFHGSVYYFLRNNVFDARNFFDLSLDVPPFRRNQFGGAAGGPIKKDRTFFFSNAESLHELRSLSSSVSTLAPQVHNGTLCANTACTQTTQVAINQKAQPYLALYPLPNGTVSGNTGIFNYPNPRRGLENYVIGKIDHYFSTSTMLSGSYSYDDATVSLYDDFNLKQLDYPGRRQNVVLSLQHIFSPSLINTTRVGVSRAHQGQNIDGSPNNPALIDTSLGFLPGQTMGLITIPGVSGQFAGIGAGYGGNGRNFFGYTTPQAYDDLTWTRGRQSIRVGFSFERIDYNFDSQNQINGNFTFGSIQNFLLGVPSQFNSDLPGTNTARGERMSVIAGYFQDDIRLFSNLTLNLGVRYEVGTVVSEVDGKTANLRNLTDTKPAIGDPFYRNPTLKNFAPRLGFAWDPFRDGKTSVRGGFGIYHIVPLPYLFAQRYSRTTPFFDGGVLPNPPPATFPSTAYQLLTVTTLRSINIEFEPHAAYKAQWNFNVQRQLTRDLALTVGYVGSAGVHLVHINEDADQVPLSLVTSNGTNLIFPVPAAGQAIQRINPSFGRIGQTLWNGHSSYHALQTNLVQRPLKGLTYQIAYTWSKSIDNGSSTFNEAENINSTGAAYAFCERCNRAVSDFDIPHNFVANFQYNLPVAQAVQANRVANAILGGWQLGGIYTRQSGSPFSLKIGGDRAFTGNSQVGNTNGGQKPNFVNAPGCNPNAVTGNIDNYIMTQCFAFPAPGVLGNLGRDTLRMPVFRDLDFSVFKNQSLWGEKLKMQFRAEMFNILNNTNLQAQLLTIYDGSGNLQTSVGQTHSPTVNTSRQIQFGLRLLF